MSTHRTPFPVAGLDPSLPIPWRGRVDGDAAEIVSPRARAETLQKRGKRMIVAGFTITIVGVVLYCAVSFMGGSDRDLGEILFENAVPLARGTLAVLGLGTVVCLVGSFMHLKGAMDADEYAAQDSKSQEDGPES